MTKMHSQTILNNFYEYITSMALLSFIYPISTIFGIDFSGIEQANLSPKENVKRTKEGSYTDVARMILESESTIILTGAGISQESGIPTFRDMDDAFWNTHDPKECATIEGFDRAPHKLWLPIQQFIETYDAKPNSGHYAIAELENMNLVNLVVTQNIDRLHQFAGSKNVVDLHGNILQTKCRQCGKCGDDCKELLQNSTEENMNFKCKHCQGILKPNVALFGESLDGEATGEAFRSARKAMLILVIGTSARVRPASTLPRLVKSNNGLVVEINQEHTILTNHVTDVFVRGSSGRILNDVLKEVKRLREVML